MNTLKIYPKKIREKYKRNMSLSGIRNPESYHSAVLFGSLILSLIAASLSFLKFSGAYPAIIFFSAFILLQLYFYLRISLKAGGRIKKIEDMFPDFLQLMSSNLRAGMTVDRAFLLSARPEFSPLDEEIIKAGKEIATGKDIVYSLMEMGEKINSEKITKTIMLISSGLKSGGNISTLLDQIASNMREKDFIEKRAASSILMYVIFIFFAVGIGAPILFGLSSVLVEIILNLVKTLPNMDSSQMSLPFTFRDIGLSANFIIYFSMIFMAATTIISSLVIGLVNKGSEKAGLKYLIPLLVLALAIFFGVRIILGSFLKETFSAMV